MTDLHQDLSSSTLYGESTPGRSLSHHTTLVLAPRRCRRVSSLLEFYGLDLPGTLYSNRRTVETKSYLSQNNFTSKTPEWVLHPWSFNVIFLKGLITTHVIPISWWIGPMSWESNMYLVSTPGLSTILEEYREVQWVGNSGLNLDRGDGGSRNTGSSVRSFHTGPPRMNHGLKKVRLLRITNGTLTGVPH